ncbi:MAG: hypothetical protein IT379_26520, partial [Deltaproteobacteria bacterium]|nr:hypothetical protein [Deltaproteobacteria bacterium]
MGSRKIEMHWTCSACGQQNLGRHAVCQRCGDPKGKDEPYRMPGDTAAAPTVSDPALLRIANAGANWRCAYCGSDQRRFDGACNQCGASQASGRSTAGEGRPVPPAHPPPSAAYGRPRTRSAVFLWVGLGVVAMLLGTCCIGIL